MDYIADSKKQMLLCSRGNTNSVTEENSTLSVSHAWS